ncbi:hypothetical protein C8R44DRAFT_910759 [Mycena epipterygia]|nr:hypothetical protein C8R44DRAFT_910759 [Mycena epipterygia]
MSRPNSHQGQIPIDNGQPDPHPSSVGSVSQIEPEYPNQCPDALQSSAQKHCSEKADRPIREFDPKLVYISDMTSLYTTLQATSDLNVQSCQLTGDALSNRISVHIHSRINQWARRSSKILWRHGNTQRSTWIDNKPHGAKLVFPTGGWTEDRGVADYEKSSMVNLARSCLVEAASRRASAHGRKSSTLALCFSPPAPASAACSLFCALHVSAHIYAAGPPNPILLAGCMYTPSSAPFLPSSSTPASEQGSMRADRAHSSASTCTFSLALFSIIQSSPQTMYSTLMLGRRRSAALDPHGERILRAFCILISRLHVCLSSIFPIPKSSSTSAPAPGARTQPPHGHVSLPALNSSRAQNPHRSRAGRTSTSSPLLFALCPHLPISAGGGGGDTSQAAGGDVRADGGCGVDGEQGKGRNLDRAETNRRGGYFAPVCAYEAFVAVHAYGPCIALYAWTCPRNPRSSSTALRLAHPAASSLLSPRILRHFPVKRSPIPYCGRVHVNEGVRGARITLVMSYVRGTTKHVWGPGGSAKGRFVQVWVLGTAPSVGGGSAAHRVMGGGCKGGSKTHPGRRKEVTVVSSPHTLSLSMHGDAIPVHAVAGRYTRGGFLHVFPTSFPGTAASSGRPHAHLLIGTGTRVALVMAARSTTNAGAGVSVDVAHAGMHPRNRAQADGGSTGLDVAGALPGAFVLGAVPADVREMLERRRKRCSLREGVSNAYAEADPGGRKSRSRRREKGGKDTDARR